MLAGTLRRLALLYEASYVLPADWQGLYGAVIGAVDPFPIA
jgi:hypothetical protein